MKLSKIFSAGFGVFGILLMCFTIVLSFLNRNAQAKPAEVPHAASLAARQFMDALASGDYTAAETLVYGQPDFGTAMPEDETAAALWQAVSSSVAYAFAGDCYGKDNGFYQDVTVTYLDAASVTRQLPEIAREILAQRTAAAEKVSDLYEEAGTLRPEISAAILKEAMQEAISGADTASLTVTLQLMEKDANWWVLPNDSLFTALSGGIG